MGANELTDTRRANLRAWMEETGTSQSSLSEKLNLSRAYVSLLFKRYFGEKSARSIERGLNLPEGYLDASGVRSISHWETPADIGSDYYAMVPRINLTISGSRLQALDDGLPPLPFRRDWLVDHGVTKKNKLRTVLVTGRAMERYLFDGDIALIDMAQKSIIDQGVYAIVYADEIRVRRISKRIDGGLALLSFNQSFKPEEIPKEKLDLIRILGRVIFRIG